MTDWNAEAYAQRSGLQEAMAAEALETVTFEGAERVLDVGCGDGRITAALARRVPRGGVVGVDASPRMVAFAAGRFGPETHPNLRFQTADAQRLPFDREFDAAVSFNALHWALDAAAALRSIRAALKPGGRATLRLVPESARASLEDLVEATRTAPRWAAAFDGFRAPFLHLTPPEYAAEAERAGFRVDGVDVVERAWDFGSREAFQAFCEVTLVAWTERLPEPERPAFVADALDRYRPVAADRPGEENTFKFSQMNVRLSVGGGSGDVRPA
jgi:trans-aconitate 2-methyltransferase